MVQGAEFSRGWGGICWASVHCHGPRQTGRRAVPALWPPAASQQPKAQTPLGGTSSAVLPHTCLPKCHLLLLAFQPVFPALAIASVPDVKVHRRDPSNTPLLLLGSPFTSTSLQSHRLGMVLFSVPLLQFLLPLSPPPPSSLLFSHYICFFGLLVILQSSDRSLFSQPVTGHLVSHFFPYSTYTP